MSTLKDYANYLAVKYQGDLDFAMKVIKTSAELNLNHSSRFESDVEVLQELEVIKASKKSA